MRGRHTCAAPRTRSTIRRICRSRRGFLLTSEAFSSSPLGEATAVRAITWRSVLLGMAGVVLICGLTPYNDYALNNTFLVGNNLPLGLVMLLFMITVLINAPLSRWRPQAALSSGEI